MSTLKINQYLKNSYLNNDLLNSISEAPSLQVESQFTNLNTNEKARVNHFASSTENHIRLIKPLLNSETHIPYRSCVPSEYN